MRLWHYKLLPYLPKGQLLSQKRECDLIWKDIENGKQTNHILINYIWEYKDYIKELYTYYFLLEKEFKNRKFKFNYHWGCKSRNKNENLVPFKNNHNDHYLIQCFYNLQEKYDRGQKDFSEEEYKKLDSFVFNELF